MGKKNRALPLWHHQRTALKFCRDKKFVGLLMEMGTGKTRVVIERCNELKIRRALIFAPLSVLHVWEKELDQWARRPSQAILLNGTSTDKAAALSYLEGWRTPLYVITNYESALSVGYALDSIDWDVIICDESTKIKNGMAKRTKAIIRLSRGVPYRFIMTGTPITESPLDIFTQFHFLDGGQTFGTSFAKFRTEYFVSDYMGWNWTLRRSMQSRLTERIYTCCYRVTKDECLDLPPKVYEVVHAKMTAKQKKAYVTMRDQLLVELEDEEITAPIILTKLSKLSQITSGFLYGMDGKIHDLGSGKLEALKDVFEEIGTAKRVVWCRYKRDVDAIRKLCLRIGLATCGITGESNQDDRRRAVELFHKDSTVFIGQVRAGGLGIDLTPASHVIYFSNEYSLETRLQSEDRSHRPGQQHGRVLYLDLVVPKTIDTVVLHALKNKATLQETLLRQGGLEVLK